jgi:class 3 adenylate cyclase/tetratricopeptide (TPR) repeat protein
MLLMPQEQIEKRGSDPLQGKVQADSSKVQALLKTSEDVRGSNPDSAILLSRQAIELADDVGYEVGKAEGFKNIGNINFDQGNFEEALVYYNRALNVYQKESDTSGISNLQSNIGSVHKTLGDNPKALEYFIESLRNAQIVLDTKRIGTAYMNLGTVYQDDQSTFDKAIENYQLAIEMFELIDYKLGLAGTKLNFGQWYVSQKNPKEGIPYLEESLAGFKEIGFYEAYPLNALGNAYSKLGDYQLSRQYFEQALTEAAEKPNLGEETITYLGLGNISFELNQFDRAIDYYLKALELAGQTGVLENQRDGYLGLSKSYEGLSDFRNAYAAQRQYSERLDSLKTEDYAKDMSNLRVQFDLENAERENELLKTRNTLNEIQIEQAKRDEQLYLIIMGLFLAIIAGFVFQYFYIRRTNRRLAFERNRSEQILLNILPKETADELKVNGFVKTRELDQVTVLFTDFKAFSTIAERISAEELIRSVDFYFKAFDEITERNNVEKIKTIGDAYMCAAGLPHPTKTHAHDAFRAAREILQFVKDTELSPPKGIYPFRIRIGLNTGPVVSGVVGTRKFAYDIWGNTVNIAARMESGSIAGKINVSENTYQLLKDDYEFTYRGEVEVKNGLILKMYFAEVRDAVPA